MVAYLTDSQALKENSQAKKVHHKKFVKTNTVAVLLLTSLVLHSYSRTEGFTKRGVNQSAGLPPVVAFLL